MTPPKRKNYVQVDDDMPWNEKVRGVSVPARWTYASSICYAGHNETDGKVKRGALNLLDGTSRIATELVNAGLWETHPEGWLIHDYLKHNRSKAEIDAIRQKNAVNGAKGLANRYRNASDSLGELRANRPTTRDLSSDLTVGETESPGEHTDKPTAKRMASKSLAQPWDEAFREWALSEYEHAGTPEEISSQVDRCKGHHEAEGTVVKSWKGRLATWLDRWAKDQELHRARLAKLSPPAQPEPYVYRPRMSPFVDEVEA